MTPNTITVFLMDDHEIVRVGLRDLLSGVDGIEVVGESGSAVESLRLMSELRPDVALLDTRMPDGTGADVCRDIRALDPSVRVLIVTSHDDEEALFAAILAGASGFVLKQISGDDLVKGVRSVAAGRSLIDPVLVSKVMERVRTGGGAGTPRRTNDLTERERRVLDLVTEGLTNREIAARLGLGEKTVKNAVSSILAKLGLERRTQAAVVATRGGC